MNTTTNLVRAGTAYGCAFKDCPRPSGPCAGNCQLHRAVPEQITDNRTVMYAPHVDTPITYAGPEPDDEDGPPEMLAAVIVLTVVCLVLGSVIAGVLA